MFASGLFRSRAAAVTAGATVALLIGLEGADALASGRTDDDVQDASTIALFGAAMATAVTASSISLVWRRPVPRRNVPWSIGIFLIWLGASVNRVAKHQLGSAYRSKLTVVSGQQVVTSGLYRFVRHPMYSGSALICVGASVAVASPASAMWALPVGALIHRITIEEAMLRREMAEDYDQLGEGRARLIPGLW